MVKKSAIDARTESVYCLGICACDTGQSSASTQLVSQNRDHLVSLYLHLRPCHFILHEMCWLFGGVEPLAVSAGNLKLPEIRARGTDTARFQTSHVCYRAILAAV